MIDQISVGDRVQFVDARGQMRIGRAVMPSTHGGWVLNLGGKYGTPAVVDETNIVRVSKRRGSANPSKYTPWNAPKGVRRRWGRRGAMIAARTRPLHREIRELQERLGKCFEELQATERGASVADVEEVAAPSMGPVGPEQMWGGRPSAANPELLLVGINPKGRRRTKMARRKRKSRRRRRAARSCRVVRVGRKRYGWRGLVRKMGIKKAARLWRKAKRGGRIRARNPRRRRGRRRRRSFRRRRRN